MGFSPHSRAGPSDPVWRCVSDSLFWDSIGGFGQSLAEMVKLGGEAARYIDVASRSLEFLNILVIRDLLTGGGLEAEAVASGIKSKSAKLALNGASRLASRMLGLSLIVAVVASTVFGFTGRGVKIPAKALDSVWLADTCLALGLSVVQGVRNQHARKALEAQVPLAKEWVEQERVEGKADPGRRLWMRDALGSAGSEALLKGEVCINDLRAQARRRGRILMLTGLVCLISVAEALVALAAPSASRVKIPLAAIKTLIVVYLIVQSSEWIRQRMETEDSRKDPDCHPNLLIE